MEVPGAVLQEGQFVGWMTSLHALIMLPVPVVSWGSMGCRLVGGVGWGGGGDGVCGGWGGDCCRCRRCCSGGRGCRLVGVLGWVGWVGWVGGSCR